MEITTKNVEWMIERVLRDDSYSPWFKVALSAARQTEPAKAVYEIETLASILNMRLRVQCESPEKKVANESR